MPLIHIKTSITDSQKTRSDDLLKELSQELAITLKKPESCVMTMIEFNVPMTFAGTAEPCCYVEIKNIGSFAGGLAKKVSGEICNKMEKELGIPSNRTYIEFTEAKGALWGFNGDTFG